MHVVEGKRVDETPHPVRVTRIGRAVELVGAAALPATHSDLKLIVDFGDGAPGDGSYVRIAAREPADGAEPAGAWLRAVFTSLAEPDGVRIERLVDRGVAGRDPA